MAKELACKVHFHYDCEYNIPENVKEVAEYFFMQGRSEIVKLLNPHYEEWNAAYDKEVTGEDDPDYNAYIRNKQFEIIKQFNKTYAYRSVIQFYSEEDCDIAALWTYFSKPVKMRMTIELLNENEWRASL